MRRFGFRLLAFGFLFLTLGGCGGYTVKGRVVSGEFTMLDFVSTDDPRSEMGVGLQGVQVLFYRDPNRSNSWLAARGTSDQHGNFTIPIDEFGAGWMVEQWRVEAHRHGYETIDLTVGLPEAKEGKNLLIVMTPGTSIRKADDDPMKEIERWK